MKPQPFILHANDANRSNVLANLHRFLDRLPSDKPWQVTVEKHVKARTPKQNRTLWGVAEETLAQHCGYIGKRQRELLHLYLCREFFGESDDELKVGLPRRTTTTNEKGERDVIDTATAAEFFEHIRDVAAGIGCHIPDPDPLWEDK